MEKHSEKNNFHNTSHVSNQIVQPFDIIYKIGKFRKITQGDIDYY